MSAYAPLLAVLVALLVGLAVGKAWERYKLRDGRWIDRRRLRETPHYMLGLNFLVDNQVDQAIDELTQATSTDTDALEIQMILGNLYRQKGQVGRAINVHQALLQRTDLQHARARLRAALPRARLPPWRVRRSRARGVSGSRSARSVEPLRVRQPAEAVRRPAAVGRGRARPGTDRRHRRAAPRGGSADSRLPRNEIGHGAGRRRRRRRRGEDVSGRHRSRRRRSRRPI